MIEEKPISSIQDFLNIQKQDRESYTEAVWYRGHANVEWSLIPGYYRLSTPPSETTLINKFKQNASMLIDRQPKESFDWLFLMQHYGVPTRLLDWSESPLVGLYFALEDMEAHSNTDACLWRLRPAELNAVSRIIDPNEAGYIPSFEDDLIVSTYSPESLNGKIKTQSLPVATIATRNNPRIQAQMGVFTVHHDYRIPIEKVSDGSYLMKFIIPAENRAKLREEIQSLGLGKFQMFPELSSVGETIKRGLL
ncbi:FRG domain-containing protein [Kiloniella laminariae]|uniref:FRG domain-containing protein n=1 Tax=Kiloniella laminariae TaxID=454162 RepID=UPI00037F9AC8|nr:FRG domain-containing protein [Kiloniella laminariae]